MATSSVSRRPAAVPLGGLAAAAFLRRHWQKEALLVRSALTDFRGPFDAGDLFAFAARDDVESRLVMRDGARWTLAHGPFRRADPRRMPARNWTLLVQGVNLVAPAGDALLRRFSFLPFARLDDLMVSYAAPGGGVGPHVDSYDVFLLQGFGRRRWRYGRQRDVAERPRLPLPILRRFAPTHDDVLAPGDMLYLPPQYAHDGIAIDACTTYSIGFRAPTATELGTAFLDYLRDTLELPGRYADADLGPTRAPAAIAPAMRRRCERLLQGIAWDRATVAGFVGSFLSEPKPHVYFERPRPALSPAAFRRRMERHGVRLDPRTQLLYDHAHLFVNGAALAWPASGAQALRELANARALASRRAAGMPSRVSAILYNWYRDGYLHADTG